jgi:putative ABC transport system ATP-binding protein
MADTILKMEDITKIYRMGDEELKALDDVNFTVGRNEFVSVLGPSGSGKSTLMNIIGCLDTPTTGNYILNGTPVRDMDEAELARIRNREIGFIFQQFNLLARLTAEENVELPLIYSGVGQKERRERARDMLNRVGLGDKLLNYPNQLSGGQQQRVAIARAVVTEPTLLLADEPTGALDQKTGRQVMELFHQLHREGRTIIMITHDLNIARHGSRIVRILDGKLAENADIEAEESLYGTEETPAPDGGVIVTTESETRTEYQGRGEDDV